MKALCLLLVVWITLSFSQPHVWFNGINVPWNKFGYDIGTNSYDQSWFETFFTACATNHINSARFWLHCDGRASPSFNSDGTVSGLSSTFLSDLKTLVGQAKAHNVVLMITLWSFDMCKQETSTSLHADLISNQAHTTTYINNALVPLVQALSSYENVVYEVINEPEWCIKETPGTTTVQVPLVEMQRFAGMIAEAVHKHSSHKVTLGSSALKWDASKGSGIGNWWNDTSLNSAYKSQQGHLDFYQIHYYDWMYDPSWGYDPCREPTSYWGLDKPTVVGELPATGGAHYKPLDLLQCSFNNSFIGDMFWAYKADFDWHQATTAWNSFYSSHSNIASYASLVSWLKTL